MAKPYIIGIAGESGVGKSTIAEIISLFYGAENTTVISTDDLHKWERTNPIWETITHLNPEANNLELGDIHILELAQGKPIFRSVYSHKTGNFNPPLKMEPRQIVVIEGLHAFYTDISRDTIDLKIYVDTNEELKCHWKIVRDTEERGYKYNAVLDAINKRRKDATLIRDVQIATADVVVSIDPTQKIKCLGDKTEKVELSLSCRSQSEKTNEPLLTFIQEYVSEFGIFGRASEAIGEDIVLCQETGGNISIKLPKDLMLIKSSGTKMKDARKGNNFSVVNHSFLANRVSLSTDDDTMNVAIRESLVLSRYKRPSMETAFHVLMDKCVVHAHPVYLTLLLCLEDSKRIVSELFPDLDYAYIEYANPGFNLYRSISALDRTHHIFFLENHGVILSSHDMSLCFDMLTSLNNLAKDYIKANCEFEEFNLSFAEQKSDYYVFPDAVVFSKDNLKMEVQAAHNYITTVGKQVGKLRYLSQDTVHFLQHMEAEKYRTTI